MSAMDAGEVPWAFAANGFLPSPPLLRVAVRQRLVPAERVTCPFSCPLCDALRRTPLTCAVGHRPDLALK